MNGPSTDCTASVVSSNPGRIKLRNTAVSNLSASRNAVYQGLSRGYNSLSRRRCGPGSELDKHRRLALFRSSRRCGGYRSQRLGRSFIPIYAMGCGLPVHPAAMAIPPFPSFAESGRRMFPHIMGCSSFFRKDALVAVGGFDEEIEYFLDETEVQFRIHQRGLKLVPLSFGGAVLHRWRANKSSLDAYFDRSLDP